MNWGELLYTLLYGYPTPREMVDARYPRWLQTHGGLLLTLAITGASLFLGACIGAMLAHCRMAQARPRDVADRFVTELLRKAASVVVEVVRGLPVMIWVLLVFYLPFRLSGLRVPAVVLAIAALSLYAGAYFCEIARAGMRAVQPEWIDAARVLGLSRFQRIWRVKFPIVWRTMLPDVLNLAITVLKDSSVLAVVAVPELTYTGRQMQMSEPVQYGLVLLLTLAIYWSVATVLSILAARVKRSGIGTVDFGKEFAQ